MSVLLDSSVLFAALVPDESSHGESANVLRQRDVYVYVHALNETFANLTGGAVRFRLDADDAARLIREKVVERVTVVVLSAEETLEAHGQARDRGIRGGAVYDFMHLVAGRKAAASVIYTLDVSNFLAFRREGDPEIRRP